MKKSLIIMLALISMALSACSSIQEAGRKVWGTSTTYLDPSRCEALSKTYTCAYDDCYDAVLSLSNVVVEQLKNAPKETNQILKGIKTKPSVLIHAGNPFSVFQEDRLRGIIVLMDVPGQVDTTEIGVFFTKYSGTKDVKLEITSLSTMARNKAAQAIFNLLDSKFPVAK
ncbi:MAG: hypothetical protein HQL26_06280 [Candidatus Omnitrophica bacterium]|nr:hypothetical protein [Candidatus Omnitrophota bacterium]